jgi:hypothetical protein
MSLNLSSAAPRPTLFFLHLPRTGGTSLMQFLDRQFPPSQICPAHKIFEFGDLERQGELTGYAFYRGHFGINLPQSIDPDGDVVTFLRRPIPRLFSIWRHLRSQPIPFQGASGALVNYSQWVAVSAHRLDFDGFCRSMMDSESGPAIFSSMTRLLGHGSGLNLPEEPDLPEMLSRAKHALDGLAFVGFTETFDRAVSLLQHRFGWQLEPVPHINSAPLGTFSESRTFMQWLENATSADSELYEYAVEQREEVIS